MVIGQLCIVKHAFRHPHAVRKGLFTNRPQCAVVAAQRRLHLAEHIVREIAAVRSRISQQLMLLIEFLRGSQRFFRREAQLSVGFALECRQIIEQGRPYALVFPRCLRHLRRLPFDTRRDFLRHLLGFQPALTFFIDINALIIAEIRTNGVKRFGHKRIDFTAALDQHAECRRLHTADGKQHVIANCISARRIHANEPIRIRPTARAGIKRVVIRRRPQVVKARANGFIRH